jgi:hypothetical protein
MALTEDIVKPPKMILCVNSIIAARLMAYGTHLSASPLMTVRRSSVICGATSLMTSSEISTTVTLDTSAFAKHHLHSDAESQSINQHVTCSAATEIDKIAYF